MQATSKSSRDFICTIIRSFGGSKWRGKFEQLPSCGLPHRLINLLDRYLERSARRYPLPLSRSNKTDDNLLHVESPPFSNNRRINCFVKFRSNNNNTRISFENRMKGKFVKKKGHGDYLWNVSSFHLLSCYSFCYGDLESCGICRESREANVRTSRIRETLIISKSGIRRSWGGTRTRSLKTWRGELWYFAKFVGINGARFATCVFAEL